MRIALVVALLFLSACAGEKLASAPPPGVDLTGRWKLNEADSDDPLHLAQTQNAAMSAAQASPAGQGGQGGRGRGRGGGFGSVGPGAGYPPMPGMGELADGLRWPGKDVEIKQVAGVVSITSAGTTQVYRPTGEGKPRHQGRPSGDDAPPPGRDRPVRDRRDAPPPFCGWDDKTLVVQTRDSDDDGPPLAKRYSLSEDRQRLIEVVAFNGGRSGGFNLSRVWDRVTPGAERPISQ